MEFKYMQAENSSNNLKCVIFCSNRAVTNLEILGLFGQYLPPLSGGAHFPRKEACSLRSPLCLIPVYLAHLNPAAPASNYIYCNSPVELARVMAIVRIRDIADI